MPEPIRQRSAKTAATGSAAVTARLIARPAASSRGRGASTAAASTSAATCAAAAQLALAPETQRLHRDDGEDRQRHQREVAARLASRQAGEAGEVGGEEDRARRRRTGRRRSRRGRRGRGGGPASRRCRRCAAGWRTGCAAFQTRFGATIEQRDAPRRPRVAPGDARRGQDAGAASDGGEREVDHRVLRQQADADRGAEHQRPAERAAARRGGAAPASPARSRRASACRWRRAGCRAPRPGGWRRRSRRCRRRAAP